MEKLKITVIGGSASNNFGNGPSGASWPELLNRNLGEIADVKHLSRNGLTFVRGINEIAEIDTSDILIFHFGTSIGWPINLVKTGTKLGIDFASEFAFHQPSGVSKNWKRRLKYYFRRSFRNFVKYVLFFTGLYKPRASERELGDQIEAVVHLARQKCKRIIWIQHRAFLNHRILLERLVYERYYKKIMRVLKEKYSGEVELVEIPDSFMVQENYLFDCIHLSNQGHFKLKELVLEPISSKY